MIDNENDCDLPYLQSVFDNYLVYLQRGFCSPEMLAHNDDTAVCVWNS